MPTALEITWLAFMTLGAGALLIGLGSLVDGFRFLNRVKRGLVIDSSFHPRVAVFVPVRGEEPRLEATIEALRNQKYPDYRLLFIVDPGDVAERKLRGMSRAEDVEIVHSKPLHGCSGKIAALLAGLENLEDTDEVVVFADSDIRPDGMWLSSLVAPLEDPAVGASTGYRWYFATRGGVGPSLQSAWNAAAANVLFSQRWTYLWGGSYAMRRTTLESLRIEEQWKRSLSDDMVMTQALKRRGHGIVFSPRATVANYTDSSLKETVKWTDRQACLALLYAPAMRRLTLPYAVYAGSVILAALAFALAPASVSFLVAGTLLLSPVYLGLLKGGVRKAAFRAAMPEFTPEFSRHRTFFYLATAMLPVLMLLNVRRASRMSEFEWRGKVYSFSSPEDVSVGGDQTSGS